MRILFGALIFALMAELVVESGAEDQCFSGQTYNQGDTWYPHIVPSDNRICVRCSCLKAGKIDCSPKKCPEDCSAENVDQECCKICEQAEKKTKKDTTAATVGGQQPGLQKIDRKIPCMHNGIRYFDDQSFTSNSTGLSAQRADQCVQCICKRGLVLCRLKTCSTEHCETPVDVDDNCCPVCLDCMSSGKRYTHGSSWHPIIGPFGAMECVVCKCLFGRIECKRLTCKPKNKLSCSNPIKPSGQCCHTCPGSAGKTSNKRTRPRKGQNKMSYVRPNNNVYITATQVFSSIDKKLCMKPETPIVVYKSHASTDTSGYYQFAFQASNSKDDFQVYSWTFTDGQFGYFATQHLTKSDFLVLSSTFTFQVMGATQKKFGDKFVRRAKRLQKKCTTKCHRRMERLQRNLKLKPVLLRPGSCIQDEIFLKI